MADFAKMYRKLFNSLTEAISILVQAQKETEEMYETALEPEIQISEHHEPLDE